MTFDRAGNTLDDAKKFNITSTTQTFTDWVGSTDGNDYYRFSIGSTSTLDITLDGLFDDADVQLLDSSGEIIVSPEKGGSSAELINQTLNAGDYYIRVYPWKDATTSYNLTVSATALGQPEEPNPETWTKQLGTEGDDFSNGIAVDRAGNVYITGFTDGSLGGDNAGYYDTWLAKYNSSGNQLWKTQLGTADDDFSYSVAVDNNGNAYITGHNEGTWLGGIDNGWNDYNALIAKYDSNGNLLWTDQVDYVGENEYSYSIAVGGANYIYMTGVVNKIQRGAIPNTWLSKHSSNGKHQWKTKLNAYAETTTVEADSAGNIYVAGYFDNFFGKKFIESAWIAKYNSSGKKLSFKCLDTLDFDIIRDIDVDITGNVYITGYTTNEPSKGNYSGDYYALVAKYDICGKLLWSKRLDNTGDDFTTLVAVSDDGSVYITGKTEGTIQAGNPGTRNNWVAKYSSNGTLIWTQKLDIYSENVNSMTVDETGNIYITGETENRSSTNSFQDVDAFVSKYAYPA
ncbi:MAG: SBBP repeat-containing protein [Cyanobacteria bacterium J06635_10]